MRYRTILADPPWDYEVWSPNGKHKSPDNHYSVMGLPALFCLPMEEICHKDAVLLMWSTWPMLEDSMRLINAWGFKYKSGLPWLKLSKSDLPRIGTGYHTRSCSEPFLIATRGKGACPSVEQREAGVLLNRVGSHSRKPDNQYCIAEKYPGPYLEMFARPFGGLDIPRDNWTQIGNEITGRDIADDLRLLAERPQP